ncbi:alkanesulfonate monooxygenase [Clostridium botulinum]|uniref:Alkanesulfonate monooxygenase n=1 Tax=Clostridium botulinum TaxID=1491 RepID=A0A9Q4TFH9_CLOBO|nr:alkanesulfonate monooxygenase [Clostridium novyi]NFD86461.1 alkanesulfonate monooxygenase [Clostridium botulinum]NFF70264.1 alkanesulfonate monooxygenase [Clostridium botulinum]NFO25184.1 alkanesulfonate monooxygenase [Clostridium botulinum]NFQ97858.1 alkanesulfonate monooxygenase [Clostridium botulinum]
MDAFILIITPPVNSVVLPTFITNSPTRGSVTPLGIPIIAILDDTFDLSKTLAIAQST